MDPGTPHPDPGAPGPVDENDDNARIRDQYLPDGRAWKQKWCRDCKLWRPHRCGHCWICGHCVLRLDHHCGFMGNCIGERNFRFFAAFLFCGGMGIISLAAVGFHHLSELGCWSDSAVWLKNWHPAAIVIFFCCCPPCPCFGLCLSTIGPGLTGGGVMFTGLMLADTDLKTDEGWKRKKMASNGFWQECTALLSCRGAWVYCCAPLSCKVLRLFRNIADDSAHLSVYEGNTKPLLPIEMEEARPLV